MANLSELEKDLQELETLLKTSTRLRTKKILEDEIKVVALAIENEKKSAPKPIVIQTEKKVEVSKTESFNPITKYAWDQEGKQVKIYLTLDGVGEVDKSNIEFKTEREEIDLKLRNYKGENWRFIIKKTHGPIDVSKSKFVQKTNAINITLTKDNSDYWSTLAAKGDKPSFSDMPKDEDPQAGLMNMMKKLYTEGDDEMKKTIAQAWSKSHSGAPM